MGAVNGKDLLVRAKDGEFQAFAQLLTWLERAPIEAALELKPLLYPTRAAFRFGITGPPGAGKSTLVAKLITHLRKTNLKIGVIAVDPSSPFTRGAILGDRIRYAEHTLDGKVFIRSLGTRGSLGGLSSSAFLMARAFDACGFDVLLVETVGVGQTELDILHVADKVCVVLVPESGDSIQAMKAGLMEIADIFVVNKADRPGAAGLAREIEASLHDGESTRTSRVLMAVASEDRGVEPLADIVRAGLQTRDALANRQKVGRLREEAKALLRGRWEETVKSQIDQVQTAEDLRNLFK